MKCDWNGLLTILPPNLRREVDRQGRDTLEELRLRQGYPIEMVLHNESRLLGISATREDIHFVINTASRYSPWSAATAAKGYITAPGGHRIGLCGEAVVPSGGMSGIRNASALCVRVARDFPGIGDKAPKSGSLLILGPPGVGKTTLLRDIIRRRSHQGMAVSVVDERGELFPDGFDRGPRTDVMTLCNKICGIEMVLRTMSPQCIAVDEITAKEDCDALLNAAGCGVELLATAHAFDHRDLRKRLIYRPIAESGLFTHVIVLCRDKSWHLERMELCT